MRSLWPPSLQQIVPVVVLVCLLGSWSLFNAFVNLNETITGISTTDRELTLWTSTQVEFNLAEFRTDVLLALGDEENRNDDRIRTSFDVLYSRLSQVSEAQMQVILDRAEADYVVPALFSIRDRMAEIVDNTPQIGNEQLSRLYELATEAQRTWHPYKFAMLEAARLDRLAKIESVTIALSNVRNHLFFGLLAAIGAGLAVTLSSFFAKKNSELLKQIELDPLTGCYSRQGFENLMTHRLSTQHRLSIAVVDINDLKQVNDSRGHSVGDDYIRLVGKALRDGFRKDDCVARIGGDEFWIAAEARPEVMLTKLDAIQVKLRETLPSASWPGENYGISYGVAAVTDHPDMDTAIAVADQRMYVQKTATRARVTRSA
jgi:diguanylate cyclase (GGDEF)-like protein